MTPVLSFKRFLEEEENSAYFKALKDELGIDPKAMKGMPQTSSFFSLGGNTFNLGSYQVVDYKYGPNGQPTHAIVKMFNDPNGNRRRYKDDGDDKTKVADYADDKTYIIPIKDLEQLMTQGMDQAAAGGGMPPPM